MALQPILKTNSKRPWSSISTVEDEVPCASIGPSELVNRGSADLPSFSAGSMYQQASCDFGYNAWTSSLEDEEFTTNALEHQPLAAPRHDVAATTICHPDIAQSIPQNHDTEPSFDEICFGTLSDIPVRLNKEWDPAQVTSILQGGFHITEFDLAFQPSHCEIFTASGYQAAVLNMQSFRAFVELRQKADVRFAGSARMSTWIRDTQQNHSTPKTVASRSRSIDVLVVGRRSGAEVVASILAANKLYLQDPDTIPAGLVYENPQCLEISFDLEADQSTLTHSILPDGLGIIEPDTTPDRSEVVEIDTIVDVFACQGDLARASVDARVSARLHSHQKEGLEFVTQRESFSLPPSRALWEQVRGQWTETGSAIFRHLITDARSSQPKECLGGVIADEMGLGKSLTMLAAIVASLDRALSWAQINTSVDVSGKGTIAAKCTLIVVPSALLMETWNDEVAARIQPNALASYKFHGYGRRVNPVHLLKHDIVLTTYGTIAADFSRDRSLLHTIHWYRIVLDEAHVIRNSSTKQFRAVTELRSYIRWCLTGTPIQNSLDDLGSMIKFLRMPIIEEAAQFRRYITRPIESSKDSSAKDYRNLRILLSSICLRRTKAVLPQVQVSEILHMIDFTTDERAEYTRIEGVCKDALNAAISGQPSKASHLNILEILLRLRLFCNNGQAFSVDDTVKFGSKQSVDEFFSVLQQSEETNCYYCSCDVGSVPDGGVRHTSVLIGCRGMVCSECMPRWEEEVKELTGCPICKSVHPLLSAEESHIERPHCAEVPSKIITLCDDIAAHMTEGKSIVFSYWKRSLDIAGVALKARGIPFLRVDGSLPFHKRKSVLQEFKYRADATVLLMTLGTGAVGLNTLSVANRVHLLEPQWNPSVETQAIGRVVRLDQQKPVTIVRYVVNKTVEKNVHSKQLRKLKLALRGFSHGKNEDTRARLQMLQELIIQK
ncbi:SNF2 family N-terminal domain-containing protein [Paraphoma chrysanthemicola]|nr:SNF2 family N-terminal domain-containing protein [Paraphoma chrysanthemicola]